MKSAVWLLSIATLGIALLPMPYGYYQLLRVFIFCSSAYLVLEYKGQAGEGWMWILIALALIYNPVLRLSLGREIWAAVNIGTLVFYIGHYMRIRSLQSGEKK